MKVSILCPTFNHGPLIHAAMRSVLRQTHQDFEVFVIGDGVTDETRTAVEELLAWDGRFHFVDREKSPRHGEAYRDEILRTRATGKVVCYLSDDDIWTPDHLTTILEALKTSDVAHSQIVSVSPEGGISSSLCDWGAAEWRQWMITPPWNNAVGLSQVGHRMALYHRLPHGWRTTPAGRWSDHYMWQQILELPDVRAEGTAAPTAILFPSPQRREMSLEARQKEVAVWERRLEDPVALRRDLRAAVATWGLGLQSAAAELHHLRMAEAQRPPPEPSCSLAEHYREMEEITVNWRASVDQKRVQIEVLKEQRNDWRLKWQVAKAELVDLKKAQAALPRWLRLLNRKLGRS